MSSIAKAAFGVLALASLAAAARPADAAIGFQREPPPCLLAPADRPAFCSRHDVRWRAAYWRRLSRARRMAFLARSGPNSGG